jgi:ABC-type glycerol-3-phosphate transport system substrate-binding protein
VVEWGDETAVRQKVAADLASRTGRYCLMVAGSDGGIQTYGAGGLLEPLDNYFTWFPQDYLDVDDVYPSFMEANRMDGQLYALPYYSFGPGMIYRKDLFDKYGLTPPKTIDELYDVLEKLKQGLEADAMTDVYPITMRGAPGEEPSLDLLGFVYAYAGYPPGLRAAPLRRRRSRPTKLSLFLPLRTSPRGLRLMPTFCRSTDRLGPLPIRG